VLFRYERVWLPDDDIAADVESVERLFDLVEKHRLATCQPAIDRGDVTFRTLRVQPGYVLRYSRFVESMCPLFTREALQRTLPTVVPLWFLVLTSGSLATLFRLKWPWRFTLRSLFIATTFLAVVLGMIAWLDRAWIGK
jgi:hypothetical protein